MSDDPLANPYTIYDSPQQSGIFWRLRAAYCFETEGKPHRKDWFLPPQQRRAGSEQQCQGQKRANNIRTRTNRKALMCSDSGRVEDHRGLLTENQYPTSPARLQEEQSIDNFIRMMSSYTWFLVDRVDVRCQTTFSRIRFQSMPLCSSLAM